jgi:hypothetical protein
MRHSARKPALVGLVAAEVVSAVLAWRDLDRRRNDQVRGSKNVWRVLISINPGNSFVYWLVARR